MQVRTQICTIHGRAHVQCKIQGKGRHQTVTIIPAAIIHAGGEFIRQCLCRPGAALFSSEQEIVQSTIHLPSHRKGI